MADKTYFAAKEPNERASILLSRSNNWFNQLYTNGYLDKLKMTWAAYHGNYYADFNDSHAISFGGEQGELVNLAVNHVRNLAQWMKNIITAARPTMMARSINTDSRSIIQTKLANGLLEYYMREKNLEESFVSAAEYAIVMGSGYIKLEWNPLLGEVYDIDEQTGTEIREGDLEYYVLSPYDVCFDINREDNRHDWVLCRSFKNRYDIIANYPEYENEILGLRSKAQLQTFYIDSLYSDDTDLIPVYEFYHRRSESMPDGNYMLFLSESIILSDGPMPYRDLPVYRISPAYILGTPLSYSPLFDILPIQDAVNSLYSTILSNQSAFGVQSIVVPTGSNVSVSELSSGMNIIEANEQNGAIRPLNLTQTPKEIFEFLKMLEAAMETISGINSVARGNPEPSLKSGTALALMQSNALSFMSSLQHSYIRLIENVGTGIINILKDHASTPRLVAIVGEKNRTNINKFTGEDLLSINRVVVDVGNPLAKTTAGRVQMAEQMLQMGLIKTPQDYFSVINTGNLDVMTEDTQSSLDVIREENERIILGKAVSAIFTDDHNLHLLKHQAVLNDQSLRFDPDVLNRALTHIQEHIGLLRTTDPALLQIWGQQALGPVNGTPPAINPPQNIPDASMQQSAPVNELPTAMQQTGMDVGQQLPEVPTPPGEFANMPVNPEEMI